MFDKICSESVKTGQSGEDRGTVLTTGSVDRSINEKMWISEARAGQFNRQVSK